MKIREYEFDGTTEEFLKIAEVIRKVPGTGPAQSNGLSHSTGNSTENAPESSEAGNSAASCDYKGRKFVSLEQAHRILTRRLLSVEMKNVLVELYNAGAKRVKSERLMEVALFTDNLGPDRFRGLMGAFGRRVRHDVGQGVVFFDKIWNTDESQCEYTLPQTVRQAMEALGWIPTTLKQSGGLSENSAQA